MAVRFLGIFCAPGHDDVSIEYGKVCHKQRVNMTEMSGGALTEV